MSNIQNRLEELQPYVIGIRYFQGLPVVDVIFKEKWAVPDSEIISKEKGEGDENYFMFYSQKEGLGIDDLLDYAESIITMNIEREKKNELLKIKVKELQKLFINNPLNKLENMKFILGGSLITTDFDPEGISIDDEIDQAISESKEEPKKEVVSRPKKGATKPTTKKVNGTNIELPPKSSNGKVEVEVYDLPPEAKEGPCNCGPEEACPKCMDSK